MDEYLFISMAKLGADRLREERVRRAVASVAGRPVKVAAARPSVDPAAGRPTAAASLLASLSLAFALTLAVIGVAVGIAATLENAPAGEVVVTQLDASGTVPGEVKVAQNEVGSPSAR